MFQFRGSNPHVEISIASQQKKFADCFHGSLRAFLHFSVRCETEQDENGRRIIRAEHQEIAGIGVKAAIDGRIDQRLRRGEVFARFLQLILIFIII